jgi:hypothetical protein
MNTHKLSKIKKTCYYMCDNCGIIVFYNPKDTNYYISYKSLDDKAYIILDDLTCGEFLMRAIL